jgi:hypothetical protein
MQFQGSSSNISELLVTSLSGLFCVYCCGVLAVICDIQSTLSCSLTPESVIADHVVWRHAVVSAKSYRSSSQLG